MSVISINGLPGKGKTLTGTMIALKHFKKENNSLKRLIRKIKKESVYVNNVYSNYPILLNKRKNKKVNSYFETGITLTDLAILINSSLLRISETT